MKRIWKTALAAIMAACALSLPAQAEEVIRLSGIPDENPTELARKYQILTDHLQKHLGKKVEYVPVVDYGAAVAALSAGKVDFAWLGGFTFVQAKALAGASPVVMRDIDRQFKSVFIANVQGGVNKPEEMKGKTFAFGAKSSTSGHLFPRHFLQTVWRLDPEKDFAGPPLYSGAHDATVKMVESGKVQVGALNIEVWNRMSKANQYDKAKLKVIWTSPEYVDYVWAARKGMPADMVQKFAQAFLSLDASRAQDKAVLELQGAQKFVKADVKDFEVIEQVGRATGLLK
ncbi:putative selenate ABC transporter substrate-binding protein [Massilia sp. W12]|uniref:putative selenate ABC transporter substrate-binding protein n=1 Tax=Massilia sp. W12 TaxID=3126507 RepID=UPI0030CD96BD